MKNAQAIRTAEQTATNDAQFETLLKRHSLAAPNSKRTGAPAGDADFLFKEAPEHDNAGIHLQRTRFTRTGGGQLHPEN